MRIVFMGSPEFAVPALVELAHSQFEVVAVYTMPDKPAGRGRVLAPSSVKKAAENLGIPVYQPESLKSPQVIENLTNLRPDVIVVAAYGQLLTPAILQIPPKGCLNIHPSLLPLHRGASPIVAALLAGDVFTGVSIMLMDNGLDTGPVVLRIAVPILPRDTTASLTPRLASLSASLLLDALVYWERGELNPQTQNEAAATYSPKITKEDGKIDWSLSVETLFRRVRAFQPWPGSFTNWEEKRIEVLWAVPLPWQKGTAETGKVIDLTHFTGVKGAFGVVTGGGLLNICQLKPAGKRAMTAAEFISGNPGIIGAILS